MDTSNSKDLSIDTISMSDGKITPVKEKPKDKEENCNNVSYKFLLRICHEFQIKLREKYLKNFVILFKKINEDEFIELVKSFEIYKEENFDENIERLLNTIDPYSNNQITFSECVSLFSMEKCQDLENQKISIIQ